MVWLERNSRIFMDAFDAGEIRTETLEDIKEKQNSRFVKFPRNVSRHVVVSEIKVPIRDEVSGY